MGESVEPGRGSVPLQVEPDIILPAQFLPRTFATPEKRLLLAVLEEAIGTFRRYVGATDGRSRGIFADVEAWFASEDTAWLYSFLAICDAIGLNAGYVRSGLKAWMDTPPTSLPEATPTRFGFRRVTGARHSIGTRSQGMQPA